MGLLDDAIREHLELKRRSGEDSRRLAQLEHEAFGPIRRGEPALDLQPPGSAPAQDEAVPTAPTDAVAEPPAVADDLHRNTQPAPAAVAPPQPPPVAYEPPPAPAPPAAPPPAVEPPPVAPSPVDQPTAAYSLDDLEALGDEPEPDDDRVQPSLLDEPEPTQVLPPEDLVPADEEPGEHDVLEETPEFLEETPEHDRLWFEQKPPRDFEF